MKLIHGHSYIFSNPLPRAFFAARAESWSLRYRSNLMLVLFRTNQISCNVSTVLVEAQQKDWLSHGSTINTTENN